MLKEVSPYRMRMRAPLFPQAPRQTAPKAPVEIWEVKPLEGFRAKRVGKSIPAREKVESLEILDLFLLAA